MRLDIFRDNHRVLRVIFYVWTGIRMRGKKAKMTKSKFGGLVDIVSDEEAIWTAFPFPEW
jgi:hypothetical protein